MTRSQRGAGLVESLCRSDLPVAIVINENPLPQKISRDQEQEPLN